MRSLCHPFLLPPTWYLPMVQIAALSFTSLLSAQTIEVPKSADAGLEVTLFAAEPMIQQPIGCAFDRHGRLLVIESHTHFRPKNWQGPEHDQIVILTDTDGDGAADRREVFFDQTDMTMDIATHPDGAIYLSTRNEILRLRDDDGDGKPEKVERRLVWMETAGNYPHNGLSGLAFDAKDGLYFGMGENLGAAYTLTGSDGSSEADEGEGGNVWHVTRDGGRLKRSATGFWNPFGVCLDPWGNVFATDNDPDSRPPCRLHHIIPGGDYGYQFRYGRTGLHPFISWNGSRLGTLPMLAGTGEAPCDVLFYAGAAHPQYRGLRTPWAGTLLVASWVDHRIESHALTPGQGTFSSKMQPLLTGGADFKPVAMAVAADGTLFVTDWVKRDYELHGKGRVWRVRAKEPAAVDAMLAQPYAADAATKLRVRIEEGQSPTLDEALDWLQQSDPYLHAATIERLAKEPLLVQELAAQTLPEPQQRAGVLIATRRGLQREGVLVMPQGFVRLLERSLKDADPRVVLVALHWVSDARLRTFRQAVELVLADAAVTPDIFYAALTTLVRLESATATENDLVKRLKDIIADPQTDAARARMAVAVLPGVDRFLTVAEVHALISKAEPEMAAWFTRLLGLMRDPARQPLLRALFSDSKQPTAVRAAALAHLELKPEDNAALVQAVAVDDATLRRAIVHALVGMTTVPPAVLSALEAVKSDELAPLLARLSGKAFFSEKRPAFTDIPGWKSLLAAVPGVPDKEQGREVFLSPKLGACATCHRMEGLGSPAGPDLSSIHSTAAPDYVLTSLLKPNANVSPQFVCFILSTADGQKRVAFQLGERGGTHTYIDLAGATFEVKIEDIVRRDQLPVSIMPEGIPARLTDVEVRDLLAYLGGL